MTDSNSRRSSPRFRVHLEVSYGNAKDFVREYAENLSLGGLFIKGGESLRQLQEVTVDLTLPGAGTFRVETRVAHVMTPEVAARCGQSAGAGLEIVRSPPGFSDALTAYLLRLGRRKDVSVMVTNTSLGLLLGAAGYVVKSIAAPSLVVQEIAHSSMPVAAVVTLEAEAAAYRRAVVAAGAGDIVCAVRDMQSMEEVLSRIDQLIEI